MVNNWENGWLLNNPQLVTPNAHYIIVYLPQYLEYLGFVLLGITIVGALVLILRTSRKT
jgi:hypothetical protein